MEGELGAPVVTAPAVEELTLGSPDSENGVPDAEPVAASEIVELIYPDVLE